MKDKATFVLGILILVGFLFYAFTFTVDHNQVSVVTTFGRADADSVYHGRTTPTQTASADVIPDARMLGNLHFRWPWPIQQVHTYDQRVRILEEQIEEQQTRDEMSIAVRTYVAWRINDPLAFLRRVASPAEAENQIRAQVRDARSVIGEYRFDQLANEDASQLALEDVEDRIRERLQRAFRGESERDDYGIEITSVGIQRIVLPAQVTQNVFERMRVTRERLASRAEAEGMATAENIRARADSARRTIMAFADRRADAIRAQGYDAAAEYYSVFNENEEFAIFLDRLDTYRQVFSNNTTFLIDANEGGLGSEFRGGPQVPLAPPTQADAPAGSPLGSSSSSSEGGSEEAEADDEDDEALTPIDLAY